MPDQPDLSLALYVHPTACFYGDVVLGEGVSVWPQAVIRCESEQVRIGRCSNLQDFVMVHVGNHSGTFVGEYCSIAHRATLHGCSIGDHCLVGIGATLMEGVVLGENSIIAGHTFLSEGKVIPPNSVVMGTPGKVVRQRNNFVHNRVNAMFYVRNAQAYARGDHRSWDGPEFAAEKARWTAAAERECLARYGRLD